MINRAHTYSNHCASMQIAAVSMLESIKKSNNGPIFSNDTWTPSTMYALVGGFEIPELIEDTHETVH